ncbi:MAG: dihydroorotase [Bacteroidota bacterium]
MHLLKHLTIADRESPENGRQCDLRIEDGIIVEIGENLLPGSEEEVIDLSDTFVSPGFIDIGPYLGDPGHEEREDITSLIAAGLRGGYVALAPLPNSEPTRHDKSGIRYLIESSKHFPLDLLPLGAISLNTEGKDITEMIDMHQTGAIAFTDGLHPVTSAGMMSRALHYVKSFSGTIINQPFDPALAPGGQMHEGIISTQLGMRGIPHLSETLCLHRDLKLLAYADSRLLVHLISTAESVDMIATAKASGLAVFASVAPLNLQYTDAALAGFDSQFKVSPPLREEADRQALLQGIRSGTIDCVVSNHIAHQEDNKKLEFPYAAFGSLGLESCLAQVNTVLGDSIATDALAALFSHGPRKALQLPPLSIAVGLPASLSFFRRDLEWTFTTDQLAGKGINSPLIGQTLRGRALGIYHRGQFYSTK